MCVIGLQCSSKNTDVIYPVKTVNLNHIRESPQLISFMDKRVQIIRIFEVKLWGI